MDWKDPEQKRAYQKAYNKAYREANREKILAGKKTWYEENKDKAKAYMTAWRESNREKDNALKAKWKIANRGKCIASAKAYNEATKERRRAHYKAHPEIAARASLLVSLGVEPPKELLELATINLQIKRALREKHNGTPK